MRRILTIAAAVLLAAGCDLLNEPKDYEPEGTPFTLTATGSDVDGDTLTYVWEQMDAGAMAPPNTDDGTRAIFRSFAPVTSPSRTLFDGSPSSKRSR